MAASSAASSYSRSRCRKRSRRRETRACSVEIPAARSWSSQKPGSPISRSSSASRAASPSGSKVITDPGELGPDLLELLLQRDDGLGHGLLILAALRARAAQAPLDGAGKGAHGLLVDRPRALVVVLLTNRVHPHAATTAIETFRAQFHDVVIEAIEP